MKRWPTSLVVGEIQMRCHYKPTQIGKIKKPEHQTLARL